jgi:transcription antitermination factor NusB
MSRREIREKVLQALYACTLTGEKEDITFTQLLQSDYQKLNREHPNDPENDAKFLYNLFFGTMRAQSAYIEMVTPRLENWDYERVAMVDRVLLNMALFEFMNCAEIPTKVTLNEYLELAKRYSTEKSNHFLNGILDPLLLQLKAEGKVVKTGKGLIETDTRPAKEVHLAEPISTVAPLKTNADPTT